MIRELKSKGFKSARLSDKNILKGRFNGMSVFVSIVTEKGKVARIILIDEDKVNESDIKIRFNKLCRQFSENSNYLDLPIDELLIPADEDISFEMIVNNKRYDAVFYQNPNEESLAQIMESAIEEVTNKYSKEEVGTPSKEELREQLEPIMLGKISEISINKPVWFTIARSFGKYYISMYYDNEYNRANGEDL